MEKLKVREQQQNERWIANGKRRNWPKWKMEEVSVRVLSKLNYQAMM
jgi:hypothetical protein